MPVMPDDEHAEPPYLDTEPPHWAARGLAWFILALFSAALVASMLVRVPETVAGPFVLVPVHGTDPVRAPRKGQVAEVRALEGQAVARGAALYIIQSEPLGDRLGELAAVEMQLRGAGPALENLDRAHAEARRADERQLEMLVARRASLERSLPLARERAQLATELASRYETGHARGQLSFAEYTAARLDAQRLAEEVVRLENERDEAVAALETLGHEIRARATAHREQRRALLEERERMQIRAATLQQDVALSADGQLQVVAPCAGTVLRLRVNTAGAVVQEGEMLGEMACSGQALQAELSVPQGAVARVREGQPVKMLYDAFPYQRYGVRHGRVRWVSPAGIRGSDGDADFVAHVELGDAGIAIDGQLRPYLPGMAGEVRVVVGRRSLASYAFEPLRQLRESMADAPPSES